jgi:hypothetical protein
MIVVVQAFKPMENERMEQRPVEQPGNIWLSVTVGGGVVSRVCPHFIIVHGCKPRTATFQPTGYG